MGDAGFWNDQQGAQTAVQQIKALKATLEPFNEIEARVRSAEELDALLELDPDPALGAELDADVAALESEVEALRRQFRTSEAEHVATTSGLAQTTFPMPTPSAPPASTQDSISTTSAGSSAAPRRSNLWPQGIVITILLGLLGALLRRRSEVSSIDGQADETSELDWTLG